MLVVWAVLVVLAIIYVVPFVVYGIASAFGGVKLPQEVSPRRFLLGILSEAVYAPAAAFAAHAILTG